MTSRYLEAPLRTLAEALAAQQENLRRQLSRQLTVYEAEANPVVRNALYDTVTDINKRLAVLRCYD